MLNILLYFWRKRQIKKLTKDMENAAKNVQISENLRGLPYKGSEIVYRSTVDMWQKRHDEFKQQRDLLSGKSSQR